MSIFGKFFTRNITYLESVTRDSNYADLLHVFGAIRIQPEDGDSFDIYRHCVIHLDTYEVTNGIEQRGNEFDIESPYAKRALESMSLKLNRKLTLARRIPADQEEDEDARGEFADLESNCEFPVEERKSTDSDTALPKAAPADCIVFTESNTGDKNRFLVELIRNGQRRNAHRFNGMHDYFRHVIYLRSVNRLLCTYRMENWIGSGGMAFFVLDATSGDLLVNKLLK